LCRSAGSVPLRFAQPCLPVGVIKYFSSHLAVAKALHALGSINRLYGGEMSNSTTQLL